LGIEEVQRAVFKQIQPSQSIQRRHGHLGVATFKLRNVRVVTRVKPLY